MNKLCVVARNSETYFMKRLREEVGNLMIWSPWSGETLPEFPNYLVRTTSVYGDDRDLTQLRTTPNPVINPVKTHELLRDKAHQFTFLEKKGFHLIPWRLLDERGDFLPENILIKPRRGQGGWGIRAMNAVEFLKWEKETTDRDWIIQPFLQPKRELRLFFCGEEEILLERTGPITANFTQGGSAIRIAIPKELEELGDEIRLMTGAIYGAIDLFETDQGHMILEVNPVPGIEQLEKVTGENIIQKILSVCGS